MVVVVALEATLDTDSGQELMHKAWGSPERPQKSQCKPEPKSQPGEETPDVIALHLKDRNVLKRFNDLLYDAPKMSDRQDVLAPFASANPPPISKIIPQGNFLWTLSHSRRVLPLKLFVLISKKRMSL